MNKNILILNLTRFGDAIQSTPLLRILRAKYPSAHITLAVQKKFASIVPLMQGYDEVVEFDQDGAARQIFLSTNPLEPYMFVEQFVSALEVRKYDLLVNLTCTRMSAFITSLLAPKAFAGISVLDDRTRTIQGAWALYLYSVILGDSRRFSRINLVDTFTKMGGGSPDGRPVELFETTRGTQFAESFLSEKGYRGGKLVGLQLGASEAIRCWPAEKFASVADQLIERYGADVVLLGAKAEKHLAERVKEKMLHRAIDAVGETDIEQLFSLTKKCSLLISNDTGTMHFAAAGGVPVVMLCIGPAFFQCTGAYSAGNIALQPAMACSPCRYNLNCLSPECVAAIGVEDVLNAALIILGRVDAATSAFGRVRAYRSVFGQDGYLHWEAMANPFPEDDIAGRCAQMWKACLDKRKPANLADTPFPEMHRLVTRGLALSSQVVQAVGGARVNVEKVRTLGTMLAALESDIKKSPFKEPALGPLVDVFTLLQDNIAPGDIKSVALRSMANYQALRDYCTCIPEVSCH